MTMNHERNHRKPQWSFNILLTVGIMLTVFGALSLARLDSLQARSDEEQPALPIIIEDLTPVSTARLISIIVNNPESTPEIVKAVVLSGSIPDDLNPRPAFITGISQGVVYTTCGAVPEGWLLYTVKPSDTLISLAFATQSTSADLMAANCLDSNQLFSGMQILLPRQPVSNPCGPPSWWTRYRVQPGDTLMGLAIQRRTTINEIVRANCRESLDLKAGQSIYLPPGTEAVEGASTATLTVTPSPVSGLVSINQDPVAGNTPLPTSPPIATQAAPQPTNSPPLPPSSTPMPTVAPTDLPTSLPTDTPLPPPTQAPNTATPLPPQKPPPSDITTPTPGSYD